MEKRQEGGGWYRSALGLTAVNLLCQGLGFLGRIGISRLAGAEVMGVYQLLMPTYGVLAAVVVSGLSMAVASLTGGVEATQGRGSGQRLLRCALVCLAVLWLAVSSVTALGADGISVALLGDARTWLGLLLLLPCVLLAGVEHLHKHYFYGVGVVKLPALVELGEQGLRAAAVLLLLAWVPAANVEEKAALIVAGLLISQLFSAGVLAAVNRRSVRQTPKVPGLGRKLMETALPLGGAAVVGSLISALRAVMTPRRLMASGMTPQGAVEGYGILFGMTLPLLSAPQCFVGALCTLLLPRLSRLWAEGRRRCCQDTILGALQAVALLVFPLLGLLSLYGGAVGERLFGQAGVGQCLPVLAAAVGLSAWNGVAAAALNGMEQQRTSALLSMVCGVAELIPAWYFTGVYGLAGCAWAMLGSAGVETGLRLGLLWRRGRLPAQGLGRILRPGLAVVLATLWTGLLERGLERYGVDAGMRHTACIMGFLFTDLLALYTMGEMSNISPKGLGRKRGKLAKKRMH